MPEEKLKHCSANDLEDKKLEHGRSEEELTDTDMENIMGGFSNDEFGTNYRYISTNLDGTRRNKIGANQSEVNFIEGPR